MTTRQKDFEGLPRKPKDDGESALTAETLLLLLAIKKGDDVNQHAKDMIATLGEVEKRSDGKLAISGTLLWQAGQILENVSDIKDQSTLLISVYEAAAKDPSAGRLDVRYSVRNQLIDAYVNSDQPLRARRYLMESFYNTDNSAQNQYNPGYGDYQDLQMYQSIATKLDVIGCPIDALAVYRHAISDPKKFELAKRWGRFT